MFLVKKCGILVVHMHTDTNSNGGITDEELAQQLYDVVMRDIEPDLLSYNAPKLAEFYKDETEAEHAKRIERYQAAYTQFESAWGAFLTKVQSQLSKHQQIALQAKEASALAEESNAIDQAANAIDSL